MALHASSLFLIGMRLGGITGITGIASPVSIMCLTPASRLISPSPFQNTFGKPLVGSSLEYSVVRYGSPHSS